MKQTTTYKDNYVRGEITILIPFLDKWKESLCVQDAITGSRTRWGVINAARRQS